MYERVIESIKQINEDKMIHPKLDFSIHLFNVVITCGDSLYENQDDISNALLLLDKSERNFSGFKSLANFYLDADKCVHLCESAVSCIDEYKKALKSGVSHSYQLKIEAKEFALIVLSFYNLK